MLRKLRLRQKNGFLIKKRVLSVPSTILLKNSCDENERQITLHSPHNFLTKWKVCIGVLEF